MKKIVFVILIALFGITIMGCSKQTATQNENAVIQYADQDFLKDMATGLEHRWEYAAEHEKEETADYNFQSSTEKESMIKCVDFELEQIEKYLDKQFEDSSLQELAISYINALKESRDACDYIPVDFFGKYTEIANEVYDKRSQIITQLVNEYGLTISEQYQSSLADFMTNAKLVKENKENEDAIRQMVDAINFELIEDSYGLKTYEGIVENTTSITFGSLMFQINLLDADGVIVGSTYADSVSNFGPGQKAKISFMTDTDFVSYQIQGTYY